MTHTDRGHCRQHESPPIQRQLSSKTKDGPLCWKAIFPQVFNICDFKIWQRWIEKVKAYLTMVWTIQKYSTTCHRQSSCIHFFFFTIRETDLSPWVMLNRSSLIHGLEDIKRQKNKKTLKHVIYFVLYSWRTNLLDILFESIYIINRVCRNNSAVKDIMYRAAAMPNHETTLYHKSWLPSCGFAT